MDWIYIIVMGVIIIGLYYSHQKNKQEMQRMLNTVDEYYGNIAQYARNNGIISDRPPPKEKSKKKSKKQKKIKPNPSLIHPETRWREIGHEISNHGK